MESSTGVRNFVDFLISADEDSDLLDGDGDTLMLDPAHSAAHQTPSQASDFGRSP